MAVNKANEIVVNIGYFSLRERVGPRGRAKWRNSRLETYHIKRSCNVKVKTSQIQYTNCGVKMNTCTLWT
jgi:hypothetical protein